MDNSQWGEAKIIADLLAEIPEHRRDRWCVDVGAGDGVTGSNTRALVEAGYNAVLIEADDSRFAALQENQPQDSKAVLVKEYVYQSGHHSLDSILKRTQAPDNFDFLSIDIDGNDYHIWESLEEYTPKIVCIEFNPTMGADLDLVQSYAPGAMVGCSIKAVKHLAATLGYGLAGLTTTNAIFVHREYCAPSDVIFHRDTQFMTWTFFGYDGQQYKVGYGKSPWTINEKPAQSED